MRADAEFFERDLVLESVRRDRSVVRKEVKNALWFRMSKPSPAGRPAIPTEMECLAEESHIKGYPAEYAAYLASKNGANVESLAIEPPPEVIIEEIPAEVEEAEPVEESLGAEI